MISMVEKLRLMYENVKEVDCRELNTKYYIAKSEDKCRIAYPKDVRETTWVTVDDALGIEMFRVGKAEIAAILGKDKKWVLVERRTGKKLYETRPSSYRRISFLNTNGIIILKSVSDDTRQYKILYSDYKHTTIDELKVFQTIWGEMVLLKHKNKDEIILIHNGIYKNIDIPQYRDVPKTNNISSLSIDIVGRLIGDRNVTGRRAASCVLGIYDGTEFIKVSTPWDEGEGPPGTILTVDNELSITSQINKIGNAITEKKRHKQYYFQYTNGIENLKKSFVELVEKYGLYVIPITHEKLFYYDNEKNDYRVSTATKREITESSGLEQSITIKNSKYSASFLRYANGHFAFIDNTSLVGSTWVWDAKNTNRIFLYKIGENILIKHGRYSILGSDIIEDECEIFHTAICDMGILYSHGKDYIYVVTEGSSIFKLDITDKYSGIYIDIIGNIHICNEETDKVSKSVMVYMYKENKFIVPKRIIETDNSLKVTNTPTDMRVAITADEKYRKKDELDLDSSYDLNNDPEKLLRYNKVMETYLKARKLYPESECMIPVLSKSTPYGLSVTIRVYDEKSGEYVLVGSVADEI